MTSNKTQAERLQEIGRSTMASIRELVAAAEQAADDCEARANAEERIREDALYAEIRDDWHVPGEDAAPGEFRILRSNGAPGARIIGTLNHDREPWLAWLEVSDGSAPWTRYSGDGTDALMLLDYASCFFFGE